jgi:hypothetical protein
MKVAKNILIDLTSVFTILVAAVPWASFTGRFGLWAPETARPRAVNDVIFGESVKGAIKPFCVGQGVGSRWSGLLRVSPS